MKNTYLLFFSIVLLACSKSKEHAPTSQFTIVKHDNYSVLRVNEAWKDCPHRFTYILGRDSSLVADSLQKYPFIKTPIQSGIYLSSTTIAFAEELNALETIKGIDDKNLLINDSLQKECINKNIIEVGGLEKLNIEQVLALKPDAIFTYAVRENKSLSKLNEAGIPVVYVTEFLAKDPLSRAEWIKFMACFYEKETLAHQIFEQITADYNELVHKEKPHDSTTILVSRAFGENWFVPGGNSYIATMIKQAGGKYAYQNIDDHGSVPRSFENVLTEASQSDIWLCNSLNWHQLSDISDDNELYTGLDAFKRKMVFNNNKRQKPNGGNDYYSSAVVHPEILLKDYITLLTQPSSDSSLTYFKKLD